VKPTPQQQRVIDAPLVGPHLVDAGAGSGKTFTLVERAAALVESGALEPGNLVVVTFTRAAATDIAGRLEERFAKYRGAGRPTCGTFHQIAASLLREFSYEIGSSPDLRVVDDARARGVFKTTFADLLAGRLAVDTSALPILDRMPVLERNLAGIALRLKNTGTSVDRFEREALAAADALEHLPFGAIIKFTPTGRLAGGKEWPKPNPPLEPAERAAEAERERSNVRAVAALFRRFDALLAAENLLTYGDVLTRAIAMLRAHPAIVATLRARWLHALVDEFQDTNPMQVAFLKALFGEDLRPVLVVGDVRQAIYAFNGADPNGIVAFRDMPGCSPYPLSENRRSYKEILEVAHHALAEANAIPSHLHTPLTAERGAAADRAVRVQLFRDDRSSEREAEAVARMARSLVDDGASPKSIAVLMRSRTKAPLFARALRQVGLAVQLHGGAGFFGAAEIREVVAWLQLVEQPDDVPSLVVALQSAAIGLGDGALAHVAANRELAHAALVASLDALSPEERVRVERFRAIARVAATLADVPLADAVRTIVFESGAEVARLGGDAGDLDQARANLDKFVRLAADFAQDRPTARIADFLVELEERAELDDDEAEAELEGERVAIMTVHASKGLEWKHVFVANVSPQSFPLRGAGGRETVVKFDEGRRALAFAHAVDGRTPLRWLLASLDVDDTDGRLLDTPKDDSEEHRLFYVALTRARDVVYVTGRLSGIQKTPSPCLESVRGWHTNRGLDPKLALLFGEEPALPVALTLPAIERLDLAETLRRLGAQIERAALPPAAADRRGTLSYTAIALNEACPRRSRYHYVFGLPDLRDEAAPLPPEDDGREQARFDPARFGRVVHLVLEAIALARIAEREPQIESYLDDALAAENCSGDVTLRAQAQRAVASASAALSEFSPLAAEERFDVEIDGVALGGYIDLVARDSRGRLAVIDYKTGTTPGEHYAEQFALYLHAAGLRYREAADTLLLRIGGESSTFETIEPASPATLAKAIAAASSMASDEPRPGPQCSGCPYAHDVCDAAPVAESYSCVLEFDFDMKAV
jgi:DNA helicase-2/ATP-dependent DNA helicase PcrA